jgi:prepilin-type N-terminal cleavage/methylation domain-containing protein
MSHLKKSLGYTLIELLIALVVSSIVIAGSYAGYTFFRQQYEHLTKKTQINRNILRAMNIIQSDILQAGYKDYQSSDTMLSTQPIRINPLLPAPQSTGDDFTLVFDDYDASLVRQRVLVRYFLATYTPLIQLYSGDTSPSRKSTTGVRQRLYRDIRKCTTPSAECFITNSTSMNDSLIFGGKGFIDSTMGLNGSPILDHVKNFKVIGLNPKNSGSFQNQFQTLQVEIEVGSPNRIEGTTKTVSKKFTFFARAKNVSLVP